MSMPPYAHLFDARDHADKLATMLEASFASTLRPAVPDQAMTRNG